jgi:Flp pilus assembly protein TadG
MRLHRKTKERSGAAVVEFAVILPVLMIFLLGTWELGRLVQVYAILNHAAREGARIAAQGQIINVTGAYTQIQVASGTPNVTQAVTNYLTGTGINTAGLTVTFSFLDSSGNLLASPTQPYQGTKGQRFRVTVNLPYSSFKISNTNLLNLTGIQASVDWVSMIDDPFTVNTTLPTWTPLS